MSARTQTRTGDTCIFSAVLYQLSYPGEGAGVLQRQAEFYLNDAKMSSLAFVPHEYPFYVECCKLACGSGCVPVGAPVFKIGGRLRGASGGGFDSHPLPPIF